uniref:Hemocyanin, beta-C chain unit D-like n=1 Tax=Phallusia mammillata TaxID=59560 RepID=A0A6F9DX11_9ASCI|nr:hemocyanin, beta-C chain unit D-like [Phallusia mammillata]
MFYQNFDEVQSEPDVTLIPMSDATTKGLLTAALRASENKKCPTGNVFCTAKCAHGKMLDTGTGCCKCTCKKGYSIGDDNKSCNKAAWGSWSSWSTCIKSSWGGLQTRGRICKANGVTVLGRCKGVGSEGRKCSAVTKPHVTRKNVRTLTDEEMHDLVQAYTKFKAENSSDGFQYIVKWHGWPFECPWYKTIVGHGNGHCSWHAHPLFLAWHRLHIVQLEMGMNKFLKDKSIGMPYWDWTERGWTTLPYLFRDAEIFDSVLNKYVKNPFHGSIMTNHVKVINETCRTWRIPNMDGLLWEKLLLRSVIRAMNMPDYATYDLMQQHPHNQIHNCLCTGKGSFIQHICLYSMLTITYSAFDPIFSLHHSQIDRLYSLYKAIHDEVGDQDWTESSFIGSYHKMGTKMTPDKAGSFDWPMSPFCNATMNPNGVTLNSQVWTVRNSYYYEQLFGYKYDNFNLDRRSWQGLVRDLKAKHRSPYYGSARPFVSHMAPDLGVITDANTKYAAGCSLPHKLTG